LNPDRGGPSESVRKFVQAHQRAGNEVEVATFDGVSDGPLGDGYQGLVTCPVHQCDPGKSNYGFSPKLEQWLNANYHRFDGVIVNGVWQYHGVAARRTLAGRKPYVVLRTECWTLFQKPLSAQAPQKLVYWLLQEHRNLNSAQAVCFTSDEEKRVTAHGAFPSAVSVESLCLMARWDQAAMQKF
jgi:Glycosyl transferase 4-like domain